MRLLIYGINYAPELTGVGKYTAEMADAIAALGHEVRVVTAYPYYPAWKVKTGYRSWHYATETHKSIQVWRCPLWVPRKPSGLKRVLHLTSFAVSSLPLTLWQGLNWQPDVVFAIEPTFLCVTGSALAANLSRTKAWLHIQDFEIDAGFNLGLIPSNKMIRTAISSIECWIMERFARISTISERMLDRLQAKGVSLAKCVYFPNWVDTKTIYPLKVPSSLREELAIAPDTFVALYAGSMAEKQGLEMLLAVAQQVAARKDILFVLSGEGAAKKRLIDLAKTLPNVRFLDLQPEERLNALLNLANVHLLPQLPNAADLVMPSKLKGMCASGRPTIATAALGTQIAQVVQQCGLVIPPADVKAMAKAIIYLANDREKCLQLGEAARQYAIQHWDRQEVLSQLERQLLELCSLSQSDLKPSIESSRLTLNRDRL
ncbi:colanic acid biosynthesis glycosyltransferase WcaI [Cyanosarcina cf. burmensis CCALA 770]|nr:colanic acid biosynthesis glycosyltransferase WcaI [Cyanosarcina cf. burmensis CCALA 770]